MYADKPKLHQRQRDCRPGALRSLAIDVTPRCNMHCPHCYAETFREARPVDLAVLAKSLEEAYELGVFHYILQGGEPIADPQRLYAILPMLHPDESYITVVSNAWAMTPATIARLRDLQVDKICFSMDSGLPAEHDQGRGAGSYDRVVKAVDDTIAAGLITSVSTVVTHQSLYGEGFQRTVAFARSRGLRVDVQIAEPVGNWDGREDILITPEDAAYLRRLRDELPPLATGEPMIKRDLYGAAGDCCPAGTSFMSITTDGHLLPCNFLQISLGNIAERGIAEMRRDLLRSKWFDDSHPVCLCGEDHDFISRFIKPYTEHRKPLCAHEVFGL